MSEEELIDLMCNCRLQGLNFEESKEVCRRMLLYKMIEPRIPEIMSKWLEREVEKVNNG